MLFAFVLYTGHERNVNNYHIVSAPPQADAGGAGGEDGAGEAAGTAKPKEPDECDVLRESKC